MPSVAVLAMDHCLISGVVGPMEIFTIANSLAREHAPGSKDRFAPLHVASPDHNPALGFSAIPLAATMNFAKLEADVILVPPVFGPLEPMLENEKLIDRLSQLHDRGTILASSCAGSFLLAETGILNAKPATTHWQLVERFRRLYPQVDLQPDRMLIDGGSYVCAGGAMAWQDLALHLVARFLGGELASAVAKTLVMDSARRVQTPYFMFDHQSLQLAEHEDEAIDRTRQWMQGEYDTPLSVQAMATYADMGVRTFLRRFKEATGQTPLAYLQQLRIEAARHLLEVSDLSVEEITERVGYVDGSSFRRLFKARTGLTTKEYRNRFGRM